MTGFHVIGCRGIVLYFYHLIINKSFGDTSDKSSLLLAYKKLKIWFLKVKKELIRNKPFINILQLHNPCRKKNAYVLALKKIGLFHLQILWYLTNWKHWRDHLLAPHVTAALRMLLLSCCHY